jgi:hypothetical protein
MSDPMPGFPAEFNQLDPVHPIGPLPAVTSSSISSHYRVFQYVLRTGEELYPHSQINPLCWTDIIP